MPTTLPPVLDATEHIAGAYHVPLDILPEHGPEIRAAVADPVVLVYYSRRHRRVLRGVT